MLFLKRLFLCILALGVSFLALFLFRAPILRAAANAWTVNDPLTPADAIVVLGGGLETRPFAAARLYHAGLAPKILLLQPRYRVSEELGIVKTYVQIATEVLRMKGVPEASIIPIGDGVTSTQDESVAVREWALSNRAKRLIIPTDLFHTRRVRWVFENALKATEVVLSVEAITPIDYNALDWWQHEDGVISFQNEVIKYAYYRLKY